MMHNAGRAIAAILLLAALAACQPGVAVMGAGGPQYEAGDPCKGVVPEMCAY